MSQFLHHDVDNDDAKAIAIPTERVCRQQLQSSPNGFKTLWEQEKLLVTSNFFHTIFSKEVKTRACTGKG